MDRSLSFLDLSRDVLEFELFPRLDLSSLLSLTLTSKPLYQSIPRIPNKLNSLKSKFEFYKQNIPIRSVLVDCARQKHFRLLDDFLSFFSEPLRSCLETDAKYEILSEVLLSSESLSVFEKVTVGFDWLEEGPHKFTPYDSSIFWALGRSANVNLIDAFFRKYMVDVEIPSKVYEPLYIGATEANSYATITYLNALKSGRNVYGSCSVVVLKTALLHGNVEIGRKVLATSAPSSECFGNACLAPNSLDLIREFVPKDGSLLYGNIYRTIGQTGNFQLLDVFVSEGYRNFRPEETLPSAIKHCQLDFAKYLIDRYPNSLLNKIMSFSSAIQSMRIESIDFFIANFPGVLEQEDPAVLLANYFINYRGTDEDHKFWDYISSKSNTKNVLTDFAERFRFKQHSVYLRLNPKLNITPKIIEFWIQFGEIPNSRSIKYILRKVTREGFIWLVENFGELMRGLSQNVMDEFLQGRSSRKAFIEKYLRK